MNTNKRPLIIGTIMLCLLLSLMQINIKGGKVSAAKTKYLVVVQNYDDETWTAYDNIIDEKRMVDVKAITDILELKYEDRGKKQFRISRGINNSNYTIGKKVYQSSEWGDEDVDDSFKPNYAPVIKKDKKIYFYYNSLYSLVKYKYYSASKAKEYADLGYDGVVCYSKFFNITGVPSLDTVYNAKGKLFSPSSKKPTPTPTPIPTILPSDVDSKPVDYLVITNGFTRDYFDNYKEGYSGYQGIVETVDDHIMVNVNFFTDRLYSSTDNFFTTVYTYHNLDNNKFSIIVDYDEKYTSTLIFERDSKEYKQIFSNSKKVNYFTADIAPYVSKNNGFDFINPEALRPLFNKGQYEYKCYKANETETFVKKGFNDYSGVVVFDVYLGKANLPNAKQIYYNYDLSEMSKFELDKLPSTMINGVKIYGTDKFLKPSEQGGVHHSWGYYDQDLIELAYISSAHKYSNEKLGIEIWSRSLTYDHMDDSGCWTLKLTTDGNTDEYRLKIKSGWLAAGLSNATSQYCWHGGVGTDKLVRNVRNVLKAFLYKISSEPDLLYDAILDSWLADSDRISDKEYTIVGDAKVIFDVDSYEYVIGSAND